MTLRAPMTTSLQTNDEMLDQTWPCSQVVLSATSANWMMTLRAPVGTSCETIGQDRASQSAMTMLLSTPLDEKQKKLRWQDMGTGWGKQFRFNFLPHRRKHISNNSLSRGSSNALVREAPVFLVQDRIQKGPDKSVASLG